MRTKRLIATMGILWALLVGPALCSGGVLEHACEECDHAEYCDHETECREDPCPESALRPSGPDGDDLAVECAAHPAASTAAVPRPPGRMLMILVQPPQTPTLPRHPSEMPLLS